MKAMVMAAMAAGWVSILPAAALPPPLDEVNPACEVAREMAIGSADMRQSGLSRRQAARFISRFMAERLGDDWARSVMTPAERQAAAVALEGMSDEILGTAFSTAMERTAPSKRAAAHAAGMKIYDACLRRM